MWRCFDLAGPPFLCWYVLGALCRHSTLKSIGPDRFSSNSAQLAYVLHREAPVVLIFSGPWAHIKKTLFHGRGIMSGPAAVPSFTCLKPPKFVSISIMELFIHTWFTMKCVYHCIVKSQLPITIARTWLYDHWLAGQAVCCKAKLKRFIMIFGEPAKISSKI